MTKHNGNTPLLTWEPWSAGDILDVINNGSLDTYFEGYAQELYNWTQENWTVNGETGTRKQLFIRFAHEMNLHDEAYPWSNKTPASYTAAWIHVHNIFKSKNLTSDVLQWVWCVNNYDVPFEGYKAEEYYPGDEYVDWVAIDGYNVGQSVPCADWDNWRNFNDIFKTMLDRFDIHANISQKPYAITEFASSSVVDSKPIKEFNVYTNKDSPTNHFSPSGWIGDWGDITFDDSCTTNPHLGIACGNSSIKIHYSANSSQGNGWAGIRWQEGGYNLTGADILTFWARGEKGGEKAKFTAGDIDVSTGDIILTSTWQKYTLNVTDKNMCHVVCGFYWGTSVANNPLGCTIYLDDIRYESSTGINDVCVEEGISNNTKKGAWLAETYNTIKKYPKIKMACYFNIDKGGTKYLIGESDWAVFTTSRDNRNNIDDCSFDPNKRINQYKESVNDCYYIYKFPLYEPSPCFIATAAYGTPLHADINVLRVFRDEYLVTNSVGRAFVKIYYTSSPPITDLISENEGLMVVTRVGLVKPLVYVTRMFVSSIFTSFWVQSSIHPSKIFLTILVCWTATALNYHPSTDEDLDYYTLGNPSANSALRSIATAMFTQQWQK